jgi:hypothetical protein
MKDDYNIIRLGQGYSLRKTKDLSQHTLSDGYKVINAKTPAS